MFVVCAWQVIILDVRVPSVPVSRLCNHRASVNGIAWAPHSSCHICTAGQSHNVYSYDVDTNLYVQWSHSIRNNSELKTSL